MTVALRDSAGSRNGGILQSSLLWLFVSCTRKALFVNRDAPGSLYMQIFHRLMELIVSGTFPLGGAIPTQNELAQQFGASRVTIREAIKELCRRGIVKTIKGKGTFVIDQPHAEGSQNRVDGLSRSKAVQGAGEKVHSRLIGINSVGACPKIAAALKVPESTALVRISRVRYMDKRPVVLDNSYLIEKYVRHIDFVGANLETGSLYELLRTKAGIEFDQVEERYRAVVCPDDVARHLDILAGEPILNIQRVSCDHGGVAMEFSDNYERSDIYYVVIQSKRNGLKEAKVDTYDKILGSILGAAVGDAMGAFTETRTPEMIKEHFGGYVDSFDHVPPSDSFIRGCTPGTVTDDFSLAYFTAIELAKCGGEVTPEVADKAVLEWAEYPQFFRFAGPTTNAAVMALKGTPVPNKYDYLACDNNKTSNGSGMKIFPVGLINPGNLDKTIDDTLTICMPTHPNNISISGGAAIAAATAAAMKDGATLDDVIEAGIYGAKKGYELGIEKGKRCASASVEKRIPLAVEIGRKGLGWERTMLELGDIIGAGLAASEAIPATFGILAACEGDAMSAIKMGVNIGNDTDTIATMVGAIAGALYGAKGIPREYIKLIDEVNAFDLEKVAKDIFEAYYK